MSDAPSKKPYLKSNSTKRCRNWKIVVRVQSRQKKVPRLILSLGRKNDRKFCAAIRSLKWLKSWRRLQNAGAKWVKKTSISIRRLPSEVSWYDELIIALDKERYWNELKALDGLSKNLYKPKKCLSAYMIFVKEVSRRIIFLTNFVDTTKNCKRKPRSWCLSCDAACRTSLVKHDGQGTRVLSKSSWHGQSAIFGRDAGILWWGRKNR